MEKTLKEATKIELLTRYNKGLLWLKQNSSKQGTQNVLTVSGGRYDEKKYEAGISLLEKIEDELNKRFPDWKKERDEENETVNDDKVALFENGFYSIGKLNSKETLAVAKKYFGEESRYLEEDELADDLNLINENQ